MISAAVMARRNAPRTSSETARRGVPEPLAYLPDAERWLALEFYATPPWATRALTRHVLPSVGGAKDLAECSAWDPACGLGHLVAPLQETFRDVLGSDIHGYTDDLAGFTRDFLCDAGAPTDYDWIIANPPFGKAELFLERALTLARQGVAFLVRLAWLEGEGRYHNVWMREPPTIVAPFVERVSCCLGGWDPKLRGATAYAWFVWHKKNASEWQLRLIPPGCQAGLTRPGDEILAARHVPGWIAPSTLKRNAAAQLSLIEGAA